MIAPEGYTSVAAIEREIIDEFIKARNEFNEFDDAEILTQARIVVSDTLSQLDALSLFRPGDACLQISPDVLRYEINDGKPNFLFVNPRTWQPSLAGIHEEMKKYPGVMPRNANEPTESDYRAYFYIMGINGFDHLVAQVPELSKFSLVISTADAVRIRADYLKQVYEMSLGEKVDHDNIDALEAAYQARCEGFINRGERPTAKQNNAWYEINTVAGKKIVRTVKRRLKENCHLDSWKDPGLH